MKRNDLVLKTCTHISQALPKDLEDKIISFRDEVNEINEDSDYPLEYVCNMDKTPVFLYLVPSKVVDKKGGKVSVCVQQPLKRIVLPAAGKILPPFVIFKRKTLRTLKNVQVPEGVVCTTQVKAWMDEDRMIQKYGPLMCLVNLLGCLWTH